MDISGFRAFSGNHHFDLDGDIVLVVGVNGQGKTSLFDAILWVITGEISRLGQPDSVVSLYSSSGEARVEVEMALEDGQRLTATRHSVNQRDSLLVRSRGREFHGEEAEYELLRHLWPEGTTANNAQQALRSAMERGVYLQQDVLTDFLVADTEQQRFNAISELIGTGRATEFQETLERSRKAWSEATNSQASDTNELQDRLIRLEGDLRELSSTGLETMLSQDQWTAWWTEVRRLGASTTEIPSPDSLDAQRAIDRAMAELRARQRSLERRGDRLRDLSLVLSELPSVADDISELHATAEKAKQNLEAARRTLAEAEQKTAEARRQHLETRSKKEDLKVLAEITLRHLGPKCPVCQQTYDMDSTRERLESTLRSATQPAGLPASLPELIGLMKHVQVMEEEASSANAALQDAQRKEQVRTESQVRIRASLAELGISVSDKSDALRTIQSALEQNATQLQNLSRAGKRGEALALSLARTGQLARQMELEQEVRHIRSDLASARSSLKAREDTRELVSKMINGLRDASSDLVERELRKLEPLLQQIYAAADPHPEFRDVRLLSRMHYGRGRVYAEIKDILHGRTSETPTAFLSSSQMNVLAVSVFLALNLGIPALPLRLAILDDPLQSLDDLNLLGLIDLLKRMRDWRQLMVSSHDIRFASLLERKLRPVSDSQRTIIVELSGWSSEGPIAVQRDVERDRVPIRIAAA